MKKASFTRLLPDVRAIAFSPLQLPSPSLPLPTCRVAIVSLTHLDTSYEYVVYIVYCISLETDLLGNDRKECDLNTNHGLVELC